MPARVVHFHVGRSSHAFFKAQQQAAPEGFGYSASPAGEAATRRLARHGSRLAPLRRSAEWAAIRTLSSAGYVRRSRLADASPAALVHSAQLLLRDCPVPYVLDFECIEALTLYQRVTLHRPWGRALLRRALADPALRFLLPWSEAARRGIGAALGAADAVALADRTVTVLPAIPLVADRPRRRGEGPLRVLFVGTSFLAKGGLEAVRAVQRVRGSHEVSLDLVSDVPPVWAGDVRRAEGVVLHPWPASNERVRGLFARADVLLFPSHMDTLGFVMLEAMANGMPVLATAHFSTPEIVEHEVSGLVVEGENPLYGDDGLCRYERTLPPPRAFTRKLAAPSDAYVARLAESLARLAGEPGLHQGLAEGAFERVRSGPLSLASRRATLAGVYERTLER